jgi:hypothetical protein
VWEKNMVSEDSVDSYTQLLYFYCLDFSIMWQSPAVVWAANFVNAVALYCLANFHPMCTYEWKVIGEKSRHFPPTPLIYVDEAGLYQCSVTYGSVEICGEIIAVRVGNVG